MTAVAIILMAGLVLAYANGANDNFKGVATLFGSGTTNFHSALTVRQVAMLFTPPVLENPGEVRDRQGCSELITCESDEDRSRDADCVNDEKQ